MSRRKGELTRAGIDRGWPHQVALSAELTRRDFKLIQDFCRDLSLCPRGHSVFHEGEWWNVYCFAVEDHAANFTGRFGGERFHPADRKMGWAPGKKRA